MSILARLLCSHDFGDAEPWSIERESVRGSSVGIQESVVMLGEEQQCRKCSKRRVVDGSRRQYRVRFNGLTGELWAESEPPGN